MATTACHTEVHPADNSVTTGVSPAHKTHASSSPWSSNPWHQAPVQLLPCEDRGGLPAPRGHSRAPDANLLCLHDALRYFQWLALVKIPYHRTSELLNCWLSSKHKALQRQKSGGLRALHTWLGEGGCPPPHTPSPVPHPPSCVHWLRISLFRVHSFSPTCDHVLFVQHTVACGICSFPSHPRPTCSLWSTIVATALRSSAGMKNDALVLGNLWDTIWLNSYVY